MSTDIREEGVRNLESVRTSNRDLFERALRVRAVSYLAQQKIALMKQTIFEVDRSKEALSEQMRELAQNEATIARQNYELEQRTRALEDVQRTLEDRVRQRTEEIEQANSTLRNEIAERERVDREHRNLSEQYLRAQKMELVGRLAGGVAHDFNNLLTVILGSGELLRARLTEASLAQDVDSILEACRRGAALTRQLLTFARKQPCAPTVLAPARVIQSFMQLLNRVIGSNITLELEIDPAAGNVHGSASELEQVVLNLVVNAKDAMPQGGRVVIRVHRVVFGVRDPAPHGPCVAIEIQDTGEGMSAEVRQRVFEPFFTTKPAGVGTGLGLATVDRIVRDYGGRVEVESHVGQGSTFRVYFPVTDAEVTHTDWTVPERLHDLPRGQEEIVLVVDDDASVRRVVAEQLKMLGYRVTSADCARAALEILERERIDLLLIDSVMPGMAGDDLAVEVTLRWHKTAVVSMSGYSERPRPLDLSGRPLPFLEKPLELPRLAVALRAALDAVKR